jgi:hypothetical protein
VLRGIIALQNGLCAHDPSESEYLLADLVVHRLSHDLYELKCFSDSCAVNEEAKKSIVARLRQTYLYMSAKTGGSNSIM